MRHGNVTQDTQAQADTNTRLLTLYAADGQRVQRQIAELRDIQADEVFQTGSVSPLLPITARSYHYHHPPPPPPGLSLALGRLLLTMFMSHNMQVSTTLQENPMAATTSSSSISCQMLTLRWQSIQAHKI